ncbi:MAG: general secretion pathway protein GspK [Lentisphaerae bacterium]|jgi:type II secretory pathway component PulK|nr:general secretion pathway protein GspK [Lentisphaerota bacterium]
MPRATPRTAGRGSALILVLWVLGILSMLVVSFAFDAHLEGKVISFARKRRKAEALAFSGMQVARMLLDKQLSVSGNESEETKAEDRWYSHALTLRRGGSITLVEPLGEGTIRLDIEPEQVWRNINKLNEEDWERIFQAIGLPEDYWPELIDSYFDWIDPDSIPRQDGAESSDYYETLDPPYQARNAPFDTIRELLLVKGFKEAILSGGVLNPEEPKERQITITNGVQNLLTVFGDGKVNVNAVRQDNLTVLMTLPGVTELGARAIIEERETPTYAGAGTMDDDTSYRSVQDFMTRVGDELDDPAIRNFVTTRSEVFRITSVGMIDRVTRRIWAVVYTNGRIWRVLRWREEP